MVCKASWEHSSKQGFLHRQGTHAYFPEPREALPGHARDNALPLLTLYVPSAGTSEGWWKEADGKLDRSSWELPGIKRMPAYVLNTLPCILGAIKLAMGTRQGYEEQKHTYASAGKC